MARALRLARVTLEELPSQNAFHVEGAASLLGAPAPDTVGRPVPFERYKVVTADGKEIEGKLDAEGRARLSGIPPGSNNVSFPDYESEWHRV